MFYCSNAKGAHLGQGPLYTAGPQLYTAGLPSADLTNNVSVNHSFYYFTNNYLSRSI